MPKVGSLEQLAIMREAYEAATIEWLAMSYNASYQPEDCWRTVQMYLTHQAGKSGGEDEKPMATVPDRK